MSAQQGGEAAFPHTPEPWETGGYLYEGGKTYMNIWGPRKSPDDQSGPAIAWKMLAGDAKRACACVTALAGISDPEKFVADARALADQNKALLDALKAVLAEAEREEDESGLANLSECAYYDNLWQREKERVSNITATVEAAIKSAEGGKAS